MPNRTYTSALLIAAAIGFTALSIGGLSVANRRQADRLVELLGIAPHWGLAPGESSAKTS